MGIQQTMKVAMFDEEIMIMQKKNAAAKYTENLRHFFTELDRNGNGYLSVEEIRQAVADDPHTKQWLASLEIEATSSEDLYHFLEGADGEISCDDFIKKAK